MRFWREHAGTAALAAFGLPPDEALAANQHIQDRALAYRAAGVAGTLDQLRVRAFLDALNGTDSRPASGTPAAAQAPDADGTDDIGAAEDSGRGEDGGTGGGADGADSGGAGPGGNGNGGSKNGGSGGGAGVAASTMLAIPLATLLGLAENPGEAQGLGVLDPGLARQLAAAAARDPRSTWCVTVTDEHGHAIGHGCARPARRKRNPGRGAAGNRGSTPEASGNCSRDGPGLTFTPAAAPGPDGGYGTWRLTISGRDYTVKLIPIPVTDCDHRYESGGYRPGALLRHLVEVRDGQCTQPTCARAARRCDFEHAVPWDRGGRTCTCNGGCRCRRDHRVKQSPGWRVEQLPGGHHRWTTPAGRQYTQGPREYPV